MEKVYHHYKKWECAKSGMYKSTKSLDRGMINKSVRLLRDRELFDISCERVIKEWPISCEEHLTNLSLNRMAWLGQAACCINHGAIDDETKIAWSEISEVDKDFANGTANRWIITWERNYANSKDTQISLFE